VTRLRGYQPCQPLFYQVTEAAAALGGCLPPSEPRLGGSRRAGLVPEPLRAADFGGVVQIPTLLFSVSYLPEEQASDRKQRRDNIRRIREQVETTLRTEVRGCASQTSGPAKNRTYLEIGHRPPRRSEQAELRHW